MALLNDKNEKVNDRPMTPAEMVKVAKKIVELMEFSSKITQIIKEYTVEHTNELKRLYESSELIPGTRHEVHERCCIGNAFTIYNDLFKYFNIRMNDFSINVQDVKDDQHKLMDMVDRLLGLDTGLKDLTEKE